MLTQTLSCLAAAPRRALGRFTRDEGASVTVETIFILPLLLWAFIATFTYFDVYRAKSLSLKANYAISDLLSRTGHKIDMDFLNGTGEVFEYLTQSDASSWVRVSVVYCTEDCATDNRVLKKWWSKATDGKPTFSDEDIMQHFEPIIPWIAPNEQVIVVETGVHYYPPFNAANFTGIGERDFIDIVMTRPRFAPQLCWEDQNC